MSSVYAPSCPREAQPCLHPKKDRARAEVWGKAATGLGHSESKFWAEHFEEQRICVQLAKKETVLVISLDREIKEKLVST